MTRRLAAVLARPPRPGAAPPGVDPARYAAAMLDDVHDLLDRLAHVEAVIAAAPPDLLQEAAVAGWPTTPLVPVADEGAVLLVLQALQGLGAEEGAVVTADAPDLPGMLVAKLFSGLASATVAACPAEGGGLVALACRLPVPGWLAAVAVGLDDTDALDRLRAAAPSAADLVVGPGWHRMRTPEDVHRLDPGLEGWELTRALLSGR